MQNIKRNRKIINVTSQFNYHLILNFPLKNIYTNTADETVSSLKLKNQLIVNSLIKFSLLLRNGMEREKAVKHRNLSTQRKIHRRKLI